MKITAIRLRRVRGTAETEGPHWEDRAVRPLDVYPHYREDRWRPEVGQAVTYFERGEQIDDHHLRLASTFLQIDTDEGVSGVAGPLAPSAAMLVGLHLAPVVTGCDPLASEYLWDVMHRTLSHGRQGDGMMAISAIDCALWDLRGKWFGVPAAPPGRMAPPARPYRPTPACSASASAIWGWSASAPSGRRRRATARRSGFCGTAR